MTIGDLIDRPYFNNKNVVIWTTAADYQMLNTDCLIVIQVHQTPPHYILLPDATKCKGSIFFLFADEAYTWNFKSNYGQTLNGSAANPSYVGLNENTLGIVVYSDGVGFWTVGGAVF